MIRLIASDIDGTLLFPDGISPRNAAAIASFGLPRMPIALPTSFDQPFGNRVMSYTILGNATCLMHWTYIEYSLLMAIWFGIASVSGLSPWHEPRTRFQQRCVTGYSR